MSDSAFAVLYRKTTDAEATALFLRRSNGQWWLPGGKIESGQQTPSQAVHQWILQLLTIFDWHPSDIGMWRLSPEAGGHAVHLFEGYLSELTTIEPQDPSSGISKELAFFGRHQIHDHLYKEQDIPWGQAKLAIYCLNALHEHGQRAEGELLTADLGELEGLTWTRPK